MSETKPAGLHYDESRDLYELWAYGHIAAKYTPLFLEDSPLGPSIRAAANADKSVRDVMCAAVALPGMELTGTWKWERARARVVRVPWLKDGRDYIDYELQTARIGDVFYRVAKAPEVQAVFYDPPEPRRP